MTGLEASRQHAPPLAHVRLMSRWARLVAERRKQSVRPLAEATSREHGLSSNARTNDCCAPCD